MQFDPAALDYADLLRVFFTIHDPTTLNRQGSDSGSQYRSAIFTHSDAQKAIAGQVMAEIEGANVYSGKLVTELVPAPVFYPAPSRRRRRADRVRMSS